VTAASPPSNGVGRTIARLARRVDRALADVELSMPQYRVLAFLSEVDSAAASLLARRLEVSRPSITSMMDGLVARGLVERKASDDDRRRVEHRLTRKGEAALRAADHAVDQRLTALADHLEDLERVRAFDGLKAWRSALTRAREALLAKP
jgi:long-chain acyl-CoA synthetase